MRGALPRCELLYCRYTRVTESGSFSLDFGGGRRRYGLGHPPAARCWRCALANRTEIVQSRLAALLRSLIDLSVGFHDLYTVGFEDHTELPGDVHSLGVSGVCHGRACQPMDFGLGEDARWGVRGCCWAPQCLPPR